MPTLPPQRVLRKTGATIALIGLAAVACETTDIVRVYNSGAHGTIGDPALTPTDSAARLLDRMIVDELSGAYFQDGSALGPWFAAAAASFPRYVVTSVEPPDASADARAYALRRFGTTGTHGRFDDIQKLVRRQSPDAPWTRGPSISPGTSCAGGHVSAAGKASVDSVRFHVSLARAVQTAKAWYTEGLINDASLQRGTSDGFKNVARYMDHRRFHRDVSRPNIGIVISGGGSNGMFSAGAVWTLLNLIDGCLSAPDACKVDPRFRLISGTSAGAMIATVVDMFNAAWEDGRGNLVKTPRAGQEVLTKLVQWFTCLPAQQLYCVHQGNSLGVLTNGVGLVEFDGARWLLGKNVGSEVLTNTSELLLNVVDFESGAALSPSDQNPADTTGVCDVVKHALSSIPEPFVASPIRDDAGAGKPPIGFYLDGGVRSVVPIMPLIRHGADRVVVVSSSPSVVEGATPPQNALDILQRFIDISVNANGEEGIALGSAFAELQAAREQQACETLCEPSEGPFCEKFCGGAIEQACDGAPVPQERPEFPTAAIYRNESRVAPAAGYSFNPRESLPLFLAGIAAVRERCAEFASFLGGLPESIARSGCNQPIPTTASCDDPNVQWPLEKLKYSTKEPAKNAPETVRSCDPTIWNANPPKCP